MDMSVPLLQPLSVFHAKPSLLVFQPYHLSSSFIEEDLLFVSFTVKKGVFASSTDDIAHGNDAIVPLATPTVM